MSYSFNIFTSNLDLTSPPSTWLSPVADLATLHAITTDPDGSVRLILTTNSAYRWNLGSTSWQFVGLVVPTAVGSSPNANGVSVDSNNNLTLQPADGTHPGVLTSSAQTIGGSKTLPSLTYTNGGIDTSSAATLGIGTLNATTINIGNAGATVNIQGTVITETTSTLNVTNPVFTVNSGAGAGSGSNSGMQVNENNIITGYVETSANRNSWILKAPNTAGVATITPGSAGINLAGNVTGNNTGDQTITLTGDVTGSGTGSFATTLAATSNSTLTSINSLTTVGTIGTGTWQGTSVGAQYGGTGLNSSASTGVAVVNGGTWSIPSSLSISKGGTGQITASAAFNALSPVTTTGDLIVGTGVNTAGKLGIGANNTFLSSNATTASWSALTLASSQFVNQGTTTTVLHGNASGNPSWGAVVLTTDVSGVLPFANGGAGASAGDLVETSFSPANNQASPANVTGFAFANATVRSFEALVSVYVNATTSLYEAFTLKGIQKGASWAMSQTSVGDVSGFTFTITSLGQVQYTSTNAAGFVATVLKYRALTTSL